MRGISVLDVGQRSAKVGVASRGVGSTYRIQVPGPLPDRESMMSEVSSFTASFL